MSALWMTVQPMESETRLMLTAAEAGTALRARLPVVPRQPQALLLLLEAMVAWHGQRLCAVLDADARDVREHPERWSRLLGELDARHVRVQWVGLSDREYGKRDRFLGSVGDFRRAKRLVTFAATGQR
jgi:hypothetical protein